MDGDLTEEFTLNTGIHVDPSNDLNAAAERFTHSRTIAFSERNDARVRLNSA
jgi:phosphotransferase system HPr-like phosphotransfer protein